ncbi:MAG: GyrI-like domain-containing protein [Bacillaceae bacterium]
MPKMSNIELLKCNEQPALSIRTKTSVEKLPQLIGESFGKMSAYLTELNEQLADVPFVAYHNMDMHNLDVEIGFPVTTSLPAKEEINSVMIPAGKVIFCMYRGPYRDMEPLYNEMASWIEQHGYEAVGTAYEYYYNGLEFPESELLTKVVMPIK